jgi:hypothetical protein
MNRIRFVFLAFLVLALVVTGVSAKDSTVRYSVDQTLDLAWPGVDGVTAPVLHRDSIRSLRTPGSARALEVPSSITLAIVVRADGSVGRIEPIAVEHPGLGLEEAAVASVQQWLYQPALRAGTEVDSMNMVTVVFPVRQVGTLQALPGSGMPRSTMNNQFASIVNALPKGIASLNPNQYLPTAVDNNFVFATPVSKIEEGQLYNRNPVQDPTAPTDGSHFIQLPPNTTIKPRSGGG